MKFACNVVYIIKCQFRKSLMYEKSMYLKIAVHLREKNYIECFFVIFVDNTVCQTFHTFNASTGETFTVEKSCVSPNVCSSNHVGCEKTADGTMVSGINPASCVTHVGYITSMV